MLTISGTLGAIIGVALAVHAALHMWLAPWFVSDMCSEFGEHGRAGYWLYAVRRWASEAVVIVAMITVVGNGAQYVLNL